jgi:hypothetical protein
MLLAGWLLEPIQDQQKSNNQSPDSEIHDDSLNSHFKAIN